MAINRVPGVRLPTQKFLNSLKDLLRTPSTFKNIFLTANINIDIMASSTKSRAENYLALLASHGMLPAHNNPYKNLSRS